MIDREWTTYDNPLWLLVAWPGCPLLIVLAVWIRGIQ